ncbi:hypothetical protein [Actinomadura litoris]|uniref:hypothetical protein n=1 Tax=Actinomadura litoris TaxID=2678616 RepID=UPI001FEA70B9|nr:hypothetical protein [Actinomadura litoris]
MRPRAPVALPYTVSACALLLVTASAGCGESAEGSSGALEVPPPVSTPAPAAPAAPGAAAPADTSTEAPTASPTAKAGVPDGRPLGRPGKWRITTYYTASQSLYRGRAKAVRGCLRFHCSHGKDPLGSYPEDFLKVVRTEGSGHLTSGRQRGRYLNWSSSVGFWLDDTTRDSAGRPLRAWTSAAADRSVLARGRRFAITGCGREGGGRPVEAEVCRRFREARWTVTDLFRPGYGGEYHADVYIGEEHGTRLAGSPLYTTLKGATLTGVR